MTDDATSHGPDAADDLDPADIEQAEQMMRDAQERILGTPIEQIIGTHVVGFYELAAIHLSAAPPNFDAAATAIDAMSAVVHTLEGRLGPDEQTMRDALQNIQFAFVQLKNQLPAD